MYIDTIKNKMSSHRLFCLILIMVSLLFTSNLFACKLFMMVSKDTNALNPTEIVTLLTNFQAQGPGNEDGWGIVAFDKDGIPIPGYQYKYVTDNNNVTTLEITADPLRFSGNKQANLDGTNFTNAVNIISQSSPHIIIAHLRNGTSGATGITDPHPFVYQNAEGKYYAFAHNGTVPPCSVPNNNINLTQLMSGYVTTLTGNADFGKSMTGWYDYPNTIDSSQYFRYLLAQLSTNDWKMGKVVENLFNNQFNIFGSVSNGIFTTSNWAGNFVMTDGKQGFAFRRKATGVDENPYNLHTNAESGTTNYYLVLTDNFAQNPVPNMDLMINGQTDNTFPVFEYLAPGNKYLRYNVTQFINGVYKKSFERTCYFPTNQVGTRTYWGWFSYPLKSSYTLLPGSPNYIIDVEDNYSVKVGLDSWENHGIPNSPDQKYGYKARIINDDVNEFYEFNLVNHLPQNEILTLNQNSPNWVGYWLMNNQTLEDALGTHFNSVQRVYAERWSYDANSFLTYGNKNQMMEFGKMYIIELKANAGNIQNFTWQNKILTSSPAPMVQQAINYSFISQASYETLNIESLDSKSGVEEIAVFANNDCIGAVKVNQFPLQILLYTEGYEGYPLTFEVLDGSKNRNTLYTPYLINEDKKLKKAKLFAGDINFTDIRLVQSTNENNEAEYTQILNVRNYPNPSNPSTTIRFSLTEAQNVSVEIFNVKGQKVKTLVNQMLSKGTHGLVWNGTSDEQNTVSTGVYFYKIVCDKETVVRKLMFVK